MNCAYRSTRWYRVSTLLVLLMVLTACGTTPLSSANDVTTTRPTASARATVQSTVSPRPTSVPTQVQTRVLQGSPQAPTFTPLKVPTQAPTFTPLKVPTQVPTFTPLKAPTQALTFTPTQVPTKAVTVTPAPAATQAPTSAAVPPVIGSEVLFLRAGALIALNPTTNRERTLVPAPVGEFAATLDGSRVALVRGSGRTAEIWLVERDGRNLHQLTKNDRGESSLAWAPDAQAIAYAASSAATLRPQEWPAWAAWCVASEVRVLELAATVTERTIAPGCDPALSNDGRRLAYITPPTGTDPGAGARTVVNELRLVNRQGANGWNFAKATADSTSGNLIYAPAWSPDSNFLAYQRFMGYQALVDITLTEIGKSFEGKGKLVVDGGGWVAAPRFSPDGRAMLVVEHNYSDARGWGGYEEWRAQVLDLTRPGEVLLPDGTRPATATLVNRLPRAIAAAWAPDGTQLAVVLPPGWSPTVSIYEPHYQEPVSGELWLWQPTSVAPQQRLATQVDFGTPLWWLPGLK